LLNVFFLHIAIRKFLIAKKRKEKLLVTSKTNIPGLNEYIYIYNGKMPSFRTKKIEAKKVENKRNFFWQNLA
jgi:hypothetical protein